MLIDAFAPPFASDLVTTHFYDLPGPAFAVQVFNADPTPGTVQYMLLGRRN